MIVWAGWVLVALQGLALFGMLFGEAKARTREEVLQLRPANAVTAVAHVVWIIAAIMAIRG